MCIPCYKSSRNRNDEELPANDPNTKSITKYQELEQLKTFMNLEIHCIMLRRNFDQIFKEEKYVTIMKATERLRKKLILDDATRVFNPESHLASMLMLRRVMTNKTTEESFPPRRRLFRILDAIIYTSELLANEEFNKSNVICSEKNRKREENEICTICRGELDNTQNYKMLSCGHEFHAECITKYFQEYNFNKCPNCNRLETFSNIRDVIVQSQLVKNLKDGNSSTDDSL